MLQARIEEETQRAKLVESTEQARAIAAENVLQTSLTSLETRVESRTAELDWAIRNETERARSREENMTRRASLIETQCDAKFVDVQNRLLKYYADTAQNISSERSRAMQAEVAESSRAVQTEEKINVSVTMLRSNVVEVTKSLNTSLVNANRRALEVELTLSRRILALEKMLAPLVDLVTNVISSFSIITHAHPYRFVLNSSIRLNITAGKANPGEYVTLVATKQFASHEDGASVRYVSGCPGAVKGMAVIEQDGSANIPMLYPYKPLGQMEYRLCHSTRFTTLDEDFWDQKVLVSLDIIQATVTSVLVYKASTERITMGASVTFALIFDSSSTVRLAASDYIGVVSEDSLGCVDAPTTKSVVKNVSGSLVATFLTAPSLAGTYVFCHAPAISNGESMADFVRQNATFTTVASRLTAIRPLSASSDKIASNYPIQLTIQGATVGAANRVAFVNVSMLGCLDASMHSMSVEPSSVVSLSGLAPGVYKTCYVTQSTGGTSGRGTDEEYTNEGILLTVVSPIELVASQAATDTLAINTSVRFNLVGSNVHRSMHVALLPLSTTLSCTGASVSTNAYTTDSSNGFVFKLPLLPVSFKVCVADAQKAGTSSTHFVEHSKRIVVQESKVARLVAFRAQPSRTVVNAAVTFLFTPNAPGDVEEGDYVSLISMDTHIFGCASAPLTKAHIKHTVEGQFVATLVMGATVGQHVLCFADQLSGGVAATDFSRQNARMHVTTPTVSSVTVLNAVANTVTTSHRVLLAVPGARTNDLLAFLPSNGDHGCTNASFVYSKIGALDGYLRYAPVFPVAGTYKVCYTPAKDGHAVSDEDFVDQGHIITAVESVITAASTVSASNSNLLDMALYGASEGDFVALLDMDTWDGCDSAPAAKATFSCSSGIGTSLSGLAPYCVHTIAGGHSVDGMYKLCYAPAASGGDASGDFIEQALNMTAEGATQVTSVSLSVDNGAAFGSYGVRGAALSKNQDYLYVTDAVTRDIKIVQLAGGTQHLFFSGDSTFSSLRGLCSHAGDGHSIFVALPGQNSIVRISHDTPVQAHTVYADSWTSVCGSTYSPYDVLHDHVNNWLYVLCGKSNGGQIRRLDVTHGSAHVTLVNTLGNVEPQNWILSPNGIAAYVTCHKAGANARVLKVILTGSSAGTASIVGSDQGLLREPRGLMFVEDDLYIQESTYFGLVGYRALSGRASLGPMTVPIKLAQYPIEAVYRVDDGHIYSIHRAGELYKIQIVSQD
jgi:hypothetical protein